MSLKSGFFHSGRLEDSENYQVLTVYLGSRLISGDLVHVPKRSLVFHSITVTSVENQIKEMNKPESRGSVGDHI